MFTGLVEAPVCVYCDSILYLDDRLVLPGTEEEEEVAEQSQEIDSTSVQSPSIAAENVTLNEENELPQHSE